MEDIFKKIPILGDYIKAKELTKKTISEFTAKKDALEAAQHETQDALELLGRVKIEVLEPYHTFSFVYKDGSAHGIEIAFYARLLEPKENIRLTEHEDIQWVSQKEINNYKISQKEKQAMLIGFKRLKK